MGKLEYFTIILQKTTAIFSPGETISGHLKFRVTDRFKINSVSILVQGYAKTHW